MKVACYQRNVAAGRNWLDSVVDDATLASLASLVAGL